MKEWMVGAVGAVVVLAVVAALVMPVQRAEALAVADRCDVPRAWGRLVGAYNDGTGGVYAGSVKVDRAHPDWEVFEDEAGTIRWLMLNNCKVLFEQRRTP
jgi:hypothetical protein